MLRKGFHIINKVHGIMVMLMLGMVLMWNSDMYAQVFERVSVASDGTQGNGRSGGDIYAEDVAISANGVFVAFQSEAPNLVPADTNDRADIFVHDRVTGQTTRVSIASDGTQGNGYSHQVGISADGRFVAFASTSSNLVPGDTNDSFDVFVHNRDTDNDGIFDEPGFVETTRVSVASDGTEGNDHSGDYSSPIAISEDGRFVVFESYATNFVPSYSNLFVHDRVTGQTSTACRTSDGAIPDGNCGAPSISADGRFIVFYSNARNLADETDVDSDIFIRDRITGKTDRVSVGIDGSEPDGESQESCISADGRYVAFSSTASNLVPGDTTRGSDVFVYDRVAGKTTRVSVASDGTEADASSGSPSISADGRFVAFISYATNLVSGDMNGRSDVFVHDRVTGKTNRVSIDINKMGADGNSGSPSLSANGQLIALVSEATNLVTNDTNLARDVFIAGAGEDLRVEFIQSVLNRETRSDGKTGPALVAGKDLVVRAYAWLPPDATSYEVLGELCVDGSVDDCPGGHLMEEEGMVFPIGTVFSDDQRRAAKNSLNFFITGTNANVLLKPGAHTFNLRVQTLDGTFTTQVEAGFQQSATLDIYIYPVQLKDASNNDVLPDDLLLDLASSFIKHTYPVDEEGVTDLNLGGNPVVFAGLPNTSTRDKALIRLLRRRFLRESYVSRFLLEASDHKFGAGVVANLVDGNNPLDSDLTDEESLLGYTYPSIRGVVVTLDRNDKPAPNDTPVIGSTIAHEIGHQLGFVDEYCIKSFPCTVNSKAPNSPPQSTSAGGSTGTYVLDEMGAFDVNEFIKDRKALFGPPGTPLYGYMGGGNDHNSWTTQVEYEYLYTKLAKSSGAPKTQAPTSPREVVDISGIINLNGTVDLDPLFVYSTTAPVTPLAGNTYMLEFLDSAGIVLDSMGFDIIFEKEIYYIDHAEIIDVDEVPFSVAAELPADTQTIILSQGATEVASFSRSTNPPAVAITTVSVMESNIDVAWNGSDLDGDTLTYSVFYSPNGTNVHALAIDSIDLALSFNPDSFSGPQQGAFIHVRADDGFNYAEDTKALNVLTVNKDGTGSGTVTSSPAGIDCGADCTEVYNDGTQVALTATPDEGSLFAGWSGAECSGKDTCTVTMDTDVTDVTVKAIFDRADLTSPILDIKANGSDGPVTISTTDTLSVTVSLNAEGSSNTADWWVAESTPNGWYYYSLTTSWTSAGSSYTGLSPTYQGALIDLNTYEVLNTSGLSEGTHTFYFAVDTSLNGVLDLDQLYYDSVAVSVSGSSTGGSRDYKQDMRNFVQDINSYAARYDSDFIVIPQNGHELLTEDGQETDQPASSYISAIDGVGREDLFYGYNNDNEATPTEDKNYMLAFMDIAESNGVEVLVTDYCSTKSYVDDSYSQSNAKGYISFAADQRELNNIPSYPLTPHNVNTSNVTTLSGARNFLYLLNPSDTYSTKTAFINALKSTNYDVLIIDLFFGGTESLSASDVSSLKSKSNGGSRLVISYMSIGEAEDYRYYWQSDWSTSPPSWLSEENPDWPGNYKVKYWDPSWQSIIYKTGTSYLKRIIDAGFDGAYLDIIDAFEFFEDQ